MDKFKSFVVSNSTIFVFLVSFVSTVGSLIFSEIYNLDPCRLCWYQRILMYPIAIITFVALLFKVPLRKAYILSLSIPGMLIAGYHYYIQLTQGNSQLNTCGGGVSCNFIDFRIFGFVTIPLLSFIAFFLINLVVLLSFRFRNRK